jgi:predicted amidophosphoribosyltransferase
VFRSALHASLGSSRFGSPCARCGRPFPTAPAAESVQPICRLCRDNYDTFDFARSYGVYKDALHHAILLLKYEGVTRLGAWFAARLAELVAREPEAFRAEVVVPVPLHPDRQRERRYNQGELIARPLARRPHLNEGAYLLMRTKPRPAGALSQRALGPGTCRLRYSQGPAG